MNVSQKYLDLVTRIEGLETYLIPEQNPYGDYTNEELDKVRAYIFLVHAEIEYYIEQIALEEVEKAKNDWSSNSNRNIIKPVIFHLAFKYAYLDKQAKKLPFEMVMTSYQNLVKTIRKNNGIKSDNLDNIFKFIGFRIDNTLKSTLDSFGTLRGEIAHKGITAYNAPDPYSQRNNIHTILSGLKEFDLSLQQYCSPSIGISFPINYYWKKLSFIERIKILLCGRI